jgi:hypothetical protein
MSNSFGVMIARARCDSRSWRALLARAGVAVSLFEQSRSMSRPAQSAGAVTYGCSSATSGTPVSNQ